MKGRTMYQQPPPPLPPPHPQRVADSKRRELVSGVVVGALLILARITGPMLPLFSGHSLNEANGYCTGAVGLLVRGFGGAQANQACNTASHYMLALNLAAVAGAATIVICGALLLRLQQPATRAHQ